MDDRPTELVASTDQTARRRVGRPSIEFGPTRRTEFLRRVTDGETRAQALRNMKLSHRPYANAIAQDQGFRNEVAAARRAGKLANQKKNAPLDLSKLTESEATEYQRLVAKMQPSPVG